MKEIWKERVGTEMVNPLVFGAYTARVSRDCFPTYVPSTCVGGMDSFICSKGIVLFWWHLFFAIRLVAPRLYS